MCSYHPTWAYHEKASIALHTSESLGRRSSVFYSSVKSEQTLQFGCLSAHWLTQLCVLEGTLRKSVKGCIAYLIIVSSLLDLFAAPSV